MPTYGVERYRGLAAVPRLVFGVAWGKMCSEMCNAKGWSIRLYFPLFQHALVTCQTPRKSFQTVVIIQRAARLNPQPSLSRQPLAAFQVETHLVPSHKDSMKKIFLQDRWALPSSVAQRLENLFSVLFGRK